MRKLFLFKDYFQNLNNLPEITLARDSKGKVLTKSRFMAGLKCDLLLWNQYHSEYTLHYTPKNESNLHRMNIQNDSVVLSARILYPNGEEIPKSLNMYSAAKATKELIQARNIIYNASFLTSDFFSRTDILIPSEEDESWELIEVKSSINIKRDNIKSLCFQNHVAKLSGLHIKKISILNVNPNYLYDGNLNLSDFFIKVSLNEKVKFAQDEFLRQLNYYKSLITKPEIPLISSSYSCSSPKNCNLKTCWDTLSDGDIFNLREGGDLTQKLFNDGIKYIKDIPDNIELTESQKIQVESEKTGKAFIRKEKLNDFLENLKFPLYFLDFETVNPALPLYSKSKPYQHIPFLYSLHIQESHNSELLHYSYIDSGNEDPRFQILADLSKLISIKGTIICYNDTFEKRCIRESTELYPEFSEWFSSIINNFRDLSDPFKFFYYYHPAQKGSASLKAVLPALTELDYKDLDINDGNMANLEFLRAKTMNLPSEEIEEIQKFLVEYCKMDTFAMHKIINALFALV